MAVAGLYTSIFITILQVVCNSSSVQGATDQRTIQILCLFTLTNCHPDHQFECRNARLNLERMKSHHDKADYTQPSQYCFVDMKNSSMILVETLLPIVLVRKGRNIRCMQNGGVFDDSLKRIVIFTYLDFHLTRVASSIVLSEIPDTLFPVLLSSVTDQPMYPAFYLEHPLAVYSYESAFGVQIIRSLGKIKTTLKVDYFALFNLRDKETGDNTEDYYRSCRGDTTDTIVCNFVNEYPDDCVKILDVNVNDDKEIEKALRLIRRDNITFILYKGDSQLLSTFRIKAGIDKDILRKEAFIEVL